MFITFWSAPKHVLFMFIACHILFIPVSCIARPGYLDGIPVEYDHEAVLDNSPYDSDVNIPGKHFPKLAYIKILQNGYRLGYDEPRKYHNDRTVKYDKERNNLGVMSPIGPSFSRYMKRNVTAQQGGVASLVCRVDNVGDNSISWLRFDDLKVLSIGKYKYTTNTRISVMYYPIKGEWLLQISPASHNNSGKYICQISTKPVLNFIMQLSIVDYYVPQLQPRSSYQLDEEANISKDSRIDPSVYIINYDAVIPQAEKIALACIVNNAANITESIIWKHNQTVLRPNLYRIKVTKESYMNGSLVSNLVIRNATSDDSGSYSCKSPTGQESFADVKVLEGPRLSSHQDNSTSSQAPIIVNNIMLIIMYISVKLKLYVFYRKLIS